MDKKQQAQLAYDHALEYSREYLQRHIDQAKRLVESLEEKIKGMEGFDPNQRTQLGRASQYFNWGINDVENYTRNLEFNRAACRYADLVVAEKAVQEAQPRLRGKEGA